MKSRRSLFAKRRTLCSVFSVCIVSLVGAQPEQNIHAKRPSGQISRVDGAVQLFNPRPTVGVNASAQNPAFSPDGSRILFTVFESGYNFGPARLWIMNLDGSEPQPITPAGDWDDVNLPGTSWNGSRNEIVFSSDREDRTEIWRTTADGVPLSRVSNHTGLALFLEPSWSPTGNAIVFERRTDTGPGDLLIISPDGSSQTPLVTTQDDDRQPNWSPINQSILFQRYSEASDTWDLWIVESDGSGLRAYTTTPQENETDASWAPSGNAVVASADYFGASLAHLFVIRNQPGEPIQVTNSDAVEDGAPSWSPDGRSIAFESHSTDDVESASDIWIIAAPEGFASNQAEPAQWVQYR